MTQITFRCTKKEFKNIETFFYYQEYETKPSFDSIKLIVDNNEEYDYKVFFEKNKYFIVTN